MLKGFNKDGELKNVQVTDEGEIMVKMAGGGGEQTSQQTEIINTSENPVPVSLENNNVIIGNTNINAVPVNLQNQNINIGNTSSNPIPVNIQNQGITVDNTSQNAIPVNIQNQNVIVGNTSQNPVPVTLTSSIEEIETTLNASIQTVGTTASTVSINKKVTTIDVANYSETADVTVTIGNLAAVIGCGIATTLTINANVTNISLISTEADTKLQIVVKGVN